MNPLVELSKTDELKSNGLPWDTIGKAQWAYRTRHENGLEKAFIKHNRRILVDVAKAHELLRRQVA